MGPESHRLSDEHYGQLNHALPFVVRVRAIRLLRLGTAVVPLEPDELRELLARREQLLVAQERAAVQAALHQAEPEDRAELERLLRGLPVVEPCSLSASARSGTRG